MKENIYKNIGIILGLVILLSNIFIILPSQNAVSADPYDGEDLALAILANQSTLVEGSCFYSDSDTGGNRQSKILSSLGTMSPTHGSTFALFSTGTAGATPVTKNELNPGLEKGTCFGPGEDVYPLDEVTLAMSLQVPEGMHYLYYDVQFLSSEYPDWIGSAYNDKLTVTVDSPLKGSSEYMFDVNSGYFVLEAEDITGTGFDIFAIDGNPYRWDEQIDWVRTAYVNGGDDAGSSDLTPIGGERHPVSPFEIIDVTINLHDTGDNIFDSAAFIDNLIFAGWAKTVIVARKQYEDLNGGVLECGDIVKYTITISNTGEAYQHDNSGNEFEDFIPGNTTYVDDSITATSGTINYVPGANMITWNGDIPSESAISLTFQVKVDEDLENGTIISNQGNVYWDSNEDFNNDAIELTDYPHIDDGIDQDGDGDTDDDDPTNISVIAFEPPSYVTENFDFPDDHAGGKATQSDDFGHQWFETSEGLTGNVFEVACCYYYTSLNQSFKTKLRSSGSPQYWNYTLSELQSDLEWWEIWLACGDTSEAYDLFLDFENSDEEDITKIKFEYVHEGENPPTDWVLELYYWDPTNGWSQLYSDHVGGYLHNDWYKLRIGKNGDNYINYSLYRSDIGLVDFATSSQLSASFSDFERVKWSSTKNPIVCPMFFWDEHSIGLI